MLPAPGERLQRFVGDSLRFELRDRSGRKPSGGWSARLRTNLGRGDLLRREIIHARTKGVPFGGASWRDLPMKPAPDGQGWVLDIPLTEVGYFQAKAFLLDAKGWQHWPDGPDAGISVHPDVYRTANTIYCAFPRLFGASRTSVTTENRTLEEQLHQLDGFGYTAIPPSGKLRDVVRLLPHITETLGCNILHLLPVNPTPTTYARFGRYGSPYAALDLTAIDPALVEFDQRTTGVDQFRELTYATHFHGGRVILDIVINHTGWGSVLQENHPEFFLKHPDGTFASPGAWGVTWEDLVELKHESVALWDQLSEMFLTWCRRGVDGFRCDAGYKVPLVTWQYIIARVQREFPETLFLLEGLGGAWEATEALLTEGGMQWAYSELFQNYSGRDVAWYLDYAHRQCARVGLYIHYSETHDNDRLAAQRATGTTQAEKMRTGKAWSLLRNRLCALASVSGGFGFTCGVEWLATEKLRVHGSSGMAWGALDNIVSELAQLNRLLASHPCFFDGARLTRLSPPDSPVYALLRESAEGKDRLLVLVNTDVTAEQHLTLASEDLKQPAEGFTLDLLDQRPPQVRSSLPGILSFVLAPGAVHCLAPAGQPSGLAGNSYRRNRALAACAMTALGEELRTRNLGAFDWRHLARLVESSPARFLSAVSHLRACPEKIDLVSALERIMNGEQFPNVETWRPGNRNRVTLVPPGHWLLIEDTVRFRAFLPGSGADRQTGRQACSIQTGPKHVACFAPRNESGDVQLTLERYGQTERRLTATLRFLASNPASKEVYRSPNAQDLALLTNGRGGMARMAASLGHIRSKYDCALAANLHPDLPVDRHVFAKRIRAWINADGFISALDLNNLVSFSPGPPATWHFVANAGDGRTVEVFLHAAMLPGSNTTAFLFSRPGKAEATGRQLPPEADVRLTVRVDIEDRNFHWETRRNGGADHHFSTHMRTIASGMKSGPGWFGFVFAPAADRKLHVLADGGEYHPQPEWSENIPHPVEHSRGQTGGGDAFSPGWFDFLMPQGGTTTLVLSAEPDATELTAAACKNAINPARLTATELTGFEGQLQRATRAFVVKRGDGKTVIAGYPWFLDWGRDTLICARGLLAAGDVQDVLQIVLTFARFEQNGTLPNTIHGEDASNRDTTDAPLWFGIVCEELAAARAADGSEPLLDVRVPGTSRTLRDVLTSIAKHYETGTPNGIRMDPGSSLIWSPSHFTWMDTNYPAATPREGYPIEIQALWIRLLRQLAADTSGIDTGHWSRLAQQAQSSLEKLYWIEEAGHYADVLIARRNQSAAQATVDDALRSNCLFPISLGLVNDDRARRCVAAVQEHLLVPGAIRSLAPLPLKVALPVHGHDGRLLNNPNSPYRGHYEGDEDTHRKPAYHNGTAWTWKLPVFCEALVRAWSFEPSSVNAARAYLGSLDQLLQQGCLGHIPEVIDGDAPHLQRGCDAQAWSATEALRVWKLLARMTAG